MSALRSEIGVKKEPKKKKARGQEADLVDE